MPTVTYQYSISADLPSSGVAIDRLEQEIRDSGIVTALDGGLYTNGDVLFIPFKEGLPAASKTILDGDTTGPAGGLLAAHNGEPLETPPEQVQLFRTQADSTPLVAIKGRIGKEVIYATYNLCDETTWYSESVRKTEVALTTSDDTVFDSGQPCWIDMTHGKVFDEEGLIEDQQIFNPGDPHGYAPIIEVEEDPGGSPGVWTVKAERSAFETSGGDYTIDYKAGTVTFDAAIPGQNVRASFSHKGGSGWILKPLPGKALLIEKAEIQFSTDIQMNATFIMEAHGYVETFAPQFWDQQALVGSFPGAVGPVAPTDASGLPDDTLYYDSVGQQVYVVVSETWFPMPAGPYPGGTQIPIDTTKYKTIDQIIDEAIMAFPPIPILGGARGYTQERHVFQFHYAALRTLWSSLGMYLRIYIEGDEPFSGERATATFYCTSQTDPGGLSALGLLTAE